MEDPQVVFQELRRFGKGLAEDGRGDGVLPEECAGMENPGTRVGMPGPGFSWLPGQDSNLQPSG